MALSLCDCPAIHICALAIPERFWYYSCMKQEKPTRKKTSFLYPEDLLERLRQLAAQHQRSLNGELVWALELYVAQQEREGDAERGPHSN